jgi:hypothetical protein
MEMNNFIQTVSPDFYIKIGIKDGKVVHLDWSEAVHNHCNCKSCKDGILKNIKKHLQDAIKFFEQTRRT